MVVFKVFYDIERPFPKNLNKISNWHYQQTFKKHLPLTYKFIYNHHEKYGYKVLSHELQKAESDYVFEKCETLDIPFFTVHDAIYISIDNKEKVEHLFDDVIYPGASNE